MSWIGANDVLAMDQVLRERLDDAARFNAEHVFRPETALAQRPARGGSPVACGLRITRLRCILRESPSMR
jgi:hypothetical protein